MFTIMVIKIVPRDLSAPAVQEILTKYGCIIQTRIGLHEADKNMCSPSGLIILNLLHTEKEKINGLREEVELVEGVTTKIIEL